MFWYEFARKGVIFYTKKLVKVKVSESTYAILKEKSKDLEVPMALIVKSALRCYLKMKGWIKKWES